MKCSATAKARESRPGHRFPLAVAWLCAPLLALVAAGCATHRPPVSGPERRFEFDRDTFAFANLLVWEYGYDDQGRWLTQSRAAKPDYTLHCFVLARATRQFFLNARFDPRRPVVSDSTYRDLVRKVARSNPRHPGAAGPVVIPGYPDLRSFSRAHERLLKQECGSAWESYFQRGHWRMMIPFSRKSQERTAEELAALAQAGIPEVVHVVNFPILSINHALVVYGATRHEATISFAAYDPKTPAEPVVLAFDRDTRSFYLPPNGYFRGGRLDVYRVYHKWDY